MSWHGFVLMLFEFFGVCRVSLAGVFWGVGQLLLCSSDKPNEQDIKAPVQLCFITSWFSASGSVTFGHFGFLYSLLVLMLKFDSVCRPHAWNSYLQYSLAWIPNLELNHSSLSPSVGSPSRNLSQSGPLHEIEPWTIKLWSAWLEFNENKSC